MKIASSIVLKSELAAQLESTLQAYNALARHIPGAGREIYSAGFQDAINAIATAYGLAVDVTPTPPGQSLLLTG
jgi:polygalacturonase